SAARAPTFTLLAVITLALGIGANATVFGVVKSVLLNSLPYKDADRLVRVHTPLRTLAQIQGAMSAGTAIDFRERPPSFESCAIWLTPRDVTYGDGDVPRVMKSMFVEQSFFTTLGVSFAKGANFSDEDARRDTAFSTVITYATWLDIFGGKEDVIGRTVRI